MSYDSTEDEKAEWRWMERKAWRLAQDLIALGTPLDWRPISAVANAQAHEWMEAYAPCQKKMAFPADEAVRCALLARFRHALVTFADGRARGGPVDLETASFDYFAVLVDGWENGFSAKWDQKDPGLIPFPETRTADRA